MHMPASWPARRKRVARILPEGRTDETSSPGQTAVRACRATGAVYLRTAFRMGFVLTRQFRRRARRSGSAPDGAACARRPAG